jgi:hypothetical protein
MVTPVAGLAENVLLGNFAVLKDQFAGIGAAHAELVELLRGRKSLETFLDQKCRDAARPSRRIGLGVDHEDLGLRSVGDPHLAAVEDVAVARFSARVFIETTSEPAPGSDMASPPTCSPEMSFPR